MAEKRTVTLADVSPIEANFSYWTEEAAVREIEWFRRAWQAIIKAGLADYRTELERCQVAIRCITLRFIYADFLHLAIDDQCEPWFRDDVEALGVKAFQLGILLKEEDRDWVENETDEFEFYDEALRILTDRERPRIFETLCKEFGGIHQYSNSDLFVSLWRIARQETEDEVSDEEILENAVDRYNDAFCFVIMDGFICERWY